MKSKSKKPLFKEAKLGRSRSSTIFLIFAPLLILILTLLVTGGIIKQIIFTKSGFSKSSLTALKCTVEDISIQSDGKYIFAGNCSKQEPLPLPLSFASFVFRTWPNLSLDTSFGHSGRVFLLSSKRTFILKSVAVDKLDQIFLAGNTFASNSTTGEDIFTALFDKNGRLITKYGSDKGLFILNQQNSRADHVEEASLQNDDCLLLSGWTVETNGNYKTLLKKIYPEGAIDNNFRSSITDVPGQIYRSTTLFHGHDIVSVGTHNGDLLVLKNNINGIPVSDFGTNGVVKLDIKNQDEANALSILNHTHILVGGVANLNVHKFKREGNAFIVKFDLNGKLDRFFADNGLLEITSSDVSYRKIKNIHTDTQNRIIAFGTEISNDLRSRIFIKRFSENGNPDLTFGKKGEVKLKGEAGFKSSRFLTDQLIIGGSWKTLESLHLKVDTDKREISYGSKIIPANFTIMAPIPEDL